MYLVKIKITPKGCKPITFSGLFQEKKKGNKKVSEFKEACCDELHRTMIRSNRESGMLENIKCAKVEITEWKKRNLEFFFTEETLFNK